MQEKLISPKRENVDNYVLEYKSNNGTLPDILPIAESICPDEYKGKGTLRYDDTDIKVMIIMGV